MTGVERNICGNKKANAYAALALKCIFVLLPCVYVFLLCWRFDMDVTNLPATFNDEFSWYSQVFAVVEHGKPLGYWGYNGTHAATGTYGPWGASSVWFLALFIRFLRYIFPFPDFSIYIFNNLMWACTANLVLVLCAKPNIKNTLRFITVYILLFVNHTYIFMGMAETMRFSMSTILAGLTIFLWNRQNHRFYRAVSYVIAPLVIISFMTTYIMYALVLPIWLLAVYKNSPAVHKHKICYFSLSAFFFLAVTFMVYYINGQVSSPYVVDEVGDILAAFGQGVSLGIRKAFNHIRVNLNRCTLRFLWSTRKESFGWPSVYYFIYYAVGFYLLVSFLTGRKKMNAKDWEFCGIGVYMMAGYLAAFIVLYNTFTYNLLRGIHIALVYALFLLCMQSTGTSIKRFAAIMLLAVYPFLMFLRIDVVKRHKIPEDRVEYQELFAEHIILDEEKNPWENTVAVYGDEQSESVYLPVGAAVNYMLSWKANEHARYAICWLYEEGMSLPEIKEANAVPKKMWETHELLYLGEDMVLMRNKAPVLPE